MIKIRIYDRELNINQLIEILPKIDDDSVIVDISESMLRYNSGMEVFDVLCNIYRAIPYDKNLHKLMNFLEIEENSVLTYIYDGKLNNVDVIDNKKLNVSEETKEIQKHYKNITTSKENYKTNRNKRKLKDISDVPDVDFDMPTVPDLPKLD